MGKSVGDVSLPGWVVAWLYVTSLVCIWDASFIVLRPHTLPGGKYAWFWDPYKLYITVDRRYKDMTDDFIYCQSLLNYVEVAINIIALCLHYTRSKLTVPLTYTVCVMTFWKTVLYFLMYVWGDRENNTAMQELLLVVIPNGIWILLPTLCMASLWNRMTPGPSQDQQQKGTSRRKQE